MAIFLFFSMASSKLGSYILPVFPALSLLTGFFWHELSTTPNRGYHKAVVFSFIPAVTIFSAALIYLIIFPPLDLEIKFGFKNPSFSGVGTGAHYLTIENQEFSRKKAIEDALEAARKAAEREADNTTLAKFIRNLESRIYAQMAKQLVESMFSNDNPVRFGSFVLEGSTVTYEVITNEICFQIHPLWR